MVHPRWGGSRRDWRAYLTQARRRGRQAHNLLVAPSEELLPLPVDEVHLVLVGLALIQGFGPVSGEPERLREYLRILVVPALVEPS